MVVAAVTGSGDHHVLWLGGGGGGGGGWRVGGGRSKVRNFKQGKTGTVICSLQGTDRDRDSIHLTAINISSLYHISFVPRPSCSNVTLRVGQYSPISAVRFRGPVKIISQAKLTFPSEVAKKLVLPARLQLRYIRYTPYYMYLHYSQFVGKIITQPLYPVDRILTTINDHAHINYVVVQCTIVPWQSVCFYRHTGARLFIHMTRSTTSDYATLREAICESIQWNLSIVDTLGT